MDKKNETIVFEEKKSNEIILQYYKNSFDYFKYLKLLKDNIGTLYRDQYYVPYKVISYAYIDDKNGVGYYVFHPISLNRDKGNN